MVSKCCTYHPFQLISPKQIRKKKHLNGFNFVTSLFLIFRCPTRNLLKLTQTQTYSNSKLTNFSHSAKSLQMLRFLFKQYDMTDNLSSFRPDSKPSKPMQDLSYWLLVIVFCYISWDNQICCLDN